MPLISKPTQFLSLFFLVLLALCSPLSQATSTEEREEKPVTKLLNPSWTGDMDGMYKRDKVRALVVFNKMQYFLDGAEQRGASYELLKEFEKELNKKRKGAIKMHVIFIPVPRDKLIPALLEGRGDLAVANLTITAERLEQVDFSDPMLEDVDELVVSGPSAADVGSLEDLAGKEIYTRESSSYYQHLLELNEKFEAQNKPAISIRKADENLEDSDLLELVNTGAIPMIVVDKHKAEFWREIFDQIVVHEDLAIQSGGKIGWAFRKNSPRLKKAVNGFVKDHKKGTMLGNVVYKRYLKSNKWARNVLSEEEQKKFRDLMDLFRNYAGQYDFDWLMIAALSYQESQLDHDKRSPAGAVGIMQLLRSTAKDPNVGIHDIEKLESNVHAGIKYLRFLRDRYFDDPEIDELNQALFSFAAYNAGPAKISRLRKEAAEQGFNPNVWFGNLEVIVARRIGRETVQYVSNIYKYYLTYQLLLKRMEKRDKIKGAAIAPDSAMTAAATAVDSMLEIAVKDKPNKDSGEIANEAAMTASAATADSTLSVAATDAPDQNTAEIATRLTTADDNGEGEEHLSWVWYATGILVAGIAGVLLWRISTGKTRPRGAVRVSRNDP